MDVKGYVTSVKVSDYRPQVLGYGIRCHDCRVSVGVDDVRVRDMLAHLHYGAYGHFPVRTRIVNEPWTPFNPEGFIDDERLKAEGFYHIGYLPEEGIR